MTPFFGSTHIDFSGNAPSCPSRRAVLHDAQKLAKIFIQSMCPGSEDGGRTARVRYVDIGITCYGCYGLPLSIAGGKNNEKQAIIP